MTYYLGIVGSDGTKFTPDTEREMNYRIREWLGNRIWTHDPAEVCVVSGACPKGGVDIWAIQIAKEFGCQTLEFPAKKQAWEGGYKQRNIQIAKVSNEVTCFTLRGGYCPHCDRDAHIKSGGCWTTKYARKLGKTGVTLVL